MQLLIVILGMLAYRPLLGFGTHASAEDLEAAVDSWFFVPTDMAPIVVVLMSGWLFYRRRRILWSLPRQCGSKLGVAALLSLGATAYIWATLANALDLLAISLAANLLGFALLLKGAAAFRTMLLPSLVLLFIVPIPAPLLNEIVYHFQMWSAEYAGWILFKIGIPGFVSGDQIIQHGRRFVVIESCSGLRSVETLTMLSILLVDLFGRRGIHALILVLMAPFVAFGLNGFRVVGLILNPHSRIAAVHTLQGVAILLAGLVLLYLLDGALARLRKAPAPARSPSASSAPSSPVPVYLTAAIALATVVFGTVAPRWDPPASGNRTTAAQIEDGLGGWVSSRLDQTKLRFFFGTAGFRQVLLRRYRLGDGGNDVELFVGLGIHSNRYRSPISPKATLPGSGWALEDEWPVELGLDARPAVARVLRSGPRRILTYHWYEDEFGLGGETMRSFLALDRTPWARPYDATAVRLSVNLEGPNREHRQAGEDRLARFYAGLESTQETPSGT